VPSSASVAVTAYLDSANQRLRLGETAAGARMARTTIVHPICTRDTHVRATALMVLGQACVLESHFRLARTLGSRARALFARHADWQGEADACALLSYAESALGNNAEALAAARDGIKYAAQSTSSRTQACGLNYSGVSSFWARDFGTSRAVLEACAALVASRSCKAESFQPTVNLAFCELLCVLEPHPNGPRSQDYSALVSALAGATELQLDGLAGFLNRPSGDVGLFLTEFARSFLASRLGLHDESDRQYLSALLRLSRLRRASWLHALLWWAKLERQRARGKVSQAIASAQAMRQAALATSHQPLVDIASELEAQLWGSVGSLAGLEARWSRSAQANAY
jgi:hypothetical protein